MGEYAGDKLCTSGADLSGAGLRDTVFGNTNLWGVLGLATCRHIGPSILDFSTVAQSGKLSAAFLQGCGFPSKLIEYMSSLLNEPLDFYSCFISYSHLDKSFAHQLNENLRERGVRCWLDQKQLFPGDDIHDAVDHGIRVWDKVLLCCSKASLTSWWVDEEIEKAFVKERSLMQERQKKILALIPLDLDGYVFKEWINGKASQVQSRLAADNQGWDSSPEKFNQQIDRLVIVASGP